MRLALVSVVFPLIMASQVPPAIAAEPPERESVIIVFGDDPCPQSTDEEIVVCARRPDSERYRIPKSLRDEGRRPSEVSWGSRVETLEEIARDGRPGSCSVVGTWGQSGCVAAMMRQWFAERRANGSR
jgi:hypothetical protein